MILIRFEESNQAGKYNRSVEFPEKRYFYDKDIEIPSGLFIKQKTLPWERDIFELTETEIKTTGMTVAEVALGKEGIKEFINCKKQRTWQGIQMVESKEASEPLISMRLVPFLV
ncbi:hypothetical protein ACFLXT_00430 [Chloroflexota bacterium]